MTYFIGLRKLLAEEGAAQPAPSSHSRIET